MRLLRRHGADLLLGGLVLLLLLLIALPLLTLFAKSLQDRNGLFVGLANFSQFAASPELGQAARHSVTVALLTSVITLALAFPFAYGVTRSRMKGQGLFRLIAQIPLLSPSLLPALSLVYLFGNKGILRFLLMGESIYGPIGIVIAETFFVFPHALMILITALSVADARLYEAAESLGASKLRRFLTITLPAARYGLVNAGFVVFSLVMTDFGIPKVVGGSYDVLATEVFDQVVGLQNFGMGAVVGMTLLLPAILAFLAESWGARQQKALLSARAVPYRPSANRALDLPLFGFCAALALILLSVLAMALYASLITFWPYNLHLTLHHYDFAHYDEAGWSSYWTSLEMALLTAVIGSVVIFGGAYLLEKTQGGGPLKSIARLLVIIPLGVPGMVLGLAYIFFYNNPLNPLHGLYGSLVLLALSSCAHFYSVAHLTSVTALKQLDREFEAVSASLKVPMWLSFWRVTLPLCLPALLDIAIYLFVNAMTTVSVMVFLYTPDLKPASVAILNMDDSGAVAAAAAMAMMIVLASMLVRLAHGLISRAILRRTQIWRQG